MRRLLLAVSLLLSGCAVTPPDSWIAPEAVRVPGRLAIHLPYSRIDNPADLLDDLRMDSVGFREWLKPALREQIALSTRIDTITWVDSLAVVRDTTAPGWDRYTLERPAARGGKGWILVVSEVHVGRLERDAKVVDGIQGETQALALGANWLLVDRASGRAMASGSATVESPFRTSTDRSNWEDAAAALGQRMGERLPRR